MVKYDGKWIVPGPKFSYTKEFQRTGGGQKIGKVYQIKLAGTVLAFNGSPNSGGTFGTTGDLSPETIVIEERMASLTRKIEALQALFSQDGKLLEVRANGSTSTSIRCYPRFIRLTFDENLLVEEWPYVIELECDEFVDRPFSTEADFSFTEKIQSASETWDLQPSELPFTYALTHTLTAAGKTSYVSGAMPSSAWQYAKAFVVDQLGINDTISTFSANNFSSVFSSSVLSSGLITISNLGRYNYSVTENIDELAGSYSATENYILATGNFTESYAISSTFSFGEGLSTQSASIQGTVKGLYTGLNNYTERYTNAKTSFDTFVYPNLYGRVNTIASGSAFNTLPAAGSIDYNPIDGSVGYNFTFDNRETGTSGVIEQFTVTKQPNLDNWLITVKVEGSIQGRSDYSPSRRLDTAEYAYQLLDSNGTFFTRAQRFSFLSGILPLPQSKSYTVDKTNGSINYSIEYNNRLVNSAVEQYTVQKNFDRTEGMTTVSVQGEIFGMATGIYGNLGMSADDLRQKFVNASSYWVSIEPYLPLRAYGVSQVLQTGRVLSEVLGINYNVGSISYNVVYNSAPLPIFSGALSEVISVQDVGSGDIWATYGIPGRLAGPLTQRMGTRTGKSRTLSIELIMPQPTGLTYTAMYNSKPDPTPIVTAFTPAGWLQSAPTENYALQTGRYSFSVQWTENT